MSMVINLVEDHNIYLCEGGPVYNGGVQPTPITYLTQWKIVGNSEVHGNEIWSCGEYNPIDGKWHILVQPQGGSIADIALTEPLRKVNNVADTIEFPSNTDGKALVTRNLMHDTIDDKTWYVAGSRKVILCSYWNTVIKGIDNSDTIPNLLAEGLSTTYYNNIYRNGAEGISQYGGSTSSLGIYMQGCIPESGNTPTQTFYDAIVGKHILLELATPTTELVDAPQIEEADSYSMVITPGSKAVSWSSFITE